MIITKDMITRAMTLSARALERALSENGYEGDVVSSAEFVGINSTSNFVYDITFPEDHGHSSGKVFVKYNNLCKLVADY